MKKGTKKINSNFTKKVNWIDVSNKSEIQINRATQINEEELIKLRKELAEIYESIEVSFYRDNTTIENVRKRSFYDLLKNFIVSKKDIFLQDSKINSLKKIG